jgi:hypothetical protein
MATKPIDLEGAVEIRVDCGCNAYTHEVVHVPYPVIYDAMLEETPTMQRVMSDDRIRSRRPGGVWGKPTSDFKPLHIAEAAATMRTRGLIPFSPFVRAQNLELLRARDAYGDWRDQYMDALEDTPVVAADLVAPPVGLEGFAAGVTLPDAVEGEEIESTMERFSETAVEMAASFPVDASVEDLQTWIGAGPDPAYRAEFALTMERQRRKAARVSLVEWIEETYPA